MADQPEPPPKRPRGRPRKYPVTPPRNHWPRRWRRPKKNPIPAETFPGVRELDVPTVR